MSLISIAVSQSYYEQFRMNGNTPLNREKKSGTAQACSCVALIAFIVAPFSYNFIWSAWNTNVVYGSGPFVLSRAFIPERLIDSTPYRFTSYLSYGDLDDSVCSTSVIFGNVTFDNYQQWGGQYGFCDTPNGDVHVPAEAIVIQTFTILGLLLALLSTVFVCGCCAAKKVGPRSTGLVAFLAGICAIVVFSQGAAWNYFSDLRNGDGVIPVQVIADNGEKSIIALEAEGNISFGFSFMAMVLASVMLFYVAFVSFLQSRRGSLVLEQQYNDEGIEATTNNFDKPSTKRVADASVDLDQV